MEKKLNQLIKDNNFTLSLERRRETPHLYVKNEAGLYACGWYGDDYYASSKPNSESIKVTDKDGLITNESIEIAYERLLLYIEVMEKFRKRKFD